MTEQEMKEIEDSVKFVVKYMPETESKAWMAISDLVFNDIPSLIAEVRRLQADLEKYKGMTMFRCPSCAEAENMSGYTCVFGSMITNPDCAESMVCPISGEECEFEPTQE